MTKTQIYFMHGTETLEVLAKKLPKPELIWIEPRPTLINEQTDSKEVGLQDAFQGLQIPSETTSWFEISQDIVVEEARFYWQKSMLHLLAEESNAGYRYFGCSENETFLKDWGLGDVKSKEINSQIGNISKIFLRRDLKRFKLGDTLKIGGADKVQVVSYWDQNSLWAWRLLPVNEGW